MTTIALVRHGETEWNLRGLVQGITDNPLNATGRAQAVTAAALLSSEQWMRPWRAVVTSPLVRAAETGQIIAAQLDLPVHASMPTLTERDYGIAEGKSVAESMAAYPDHDYPQSETRESVAARALSALAQLHREHTGSHLIAVAHGGLIHAVLSELNGARVEPIQNTAVSIVEYSDAQAGWAIRAINNQMLPTPAV